MCGWLSCLGPSKGWTGHLGLAYAYSVGRLPSQVVPYVPAQSAIWSHNEPMG